MTHAHESKGQMIEQALADFKFQTYGASLARCLLDVSTIKEDGLSLHVAAASGDVSLIANLLESGWNSDNCLQTKYGIQIRGTTPLAVAYYGDEIAAARILIDAGANINSAKTIHDVSLLQMACVDQRVAWVEFLCQKGADIFQPNKFGESAAKLAFLNRSAHEVAAAIASAVQDVYARDENGASLMEYAILGHKLKAMHVLLRRGFDPRTLHPKSHMTPMHAAAYADSVEAVRMLSQWGGDMFAEDKNGYTPVDVAMAARSDKLRKYWDDLFLHADSALAKGTA